MDRVEIAKKLELAQVPLLKGDTDATTRASLEECLAAAISIGDAVLEARSLAQLAGFFLITGDRNSAKSHAERGLAIANGSRTETEVDLLILYSRLVLANDVGTALIHARNAFEISTELHGTPKPHVLLRYGEALGASGRFNEAFEHMRHAEELYELRMDLNGRSNVLQRLCVLLVHAGHYALVIEYAHEIIQLAAELDLPRVRINALKFLAIALTKIQRLDAAYEVARHALDLATQDPESHLKADVQGVLGDIYLELNDHRSALDRFTLAYQEYRKRGFRNGEAIALGRMAETYTRAGEYEQAESLYRRATDLALHVQNVAIHRSIVIVHAGMYVRKGDEEGANRVLGTIDSSLRSLETTTPSDATVQRAIETFRTVTAQATRIELPDPELLLNAAPTDLPPRPSFPTDSRTESPTSSPGLRANLLGTFMVVRNGDEISMEEWKRKKARDIFKLLAVHHRRPLTTDEIVQKIWGDDVAVEACVPTLQNAMSAIRTALEPSLKPRQTSTYLSFRDGAYTLDLGPNGATDIDLFRGLISSAYREDDLQVRRRLLSEATDLYQGDLLPDDVYTPWTDYVRDDLRQMCSDALDALAAVCLELGDYAAAKIAMRRAGRFEE